ncbi:MAG: D-glycerate dehydrogenase [Firmicutes bacterium]|nr:D-glycerate dehydrogenase [Bacillota bacterium]
MSFVIVVTRAIHPDALSLLNQHGTVRLWDQPHPIPRGVLQDWLKDADAALTMLTDRIDDGVLNDASSLRVVSNMAVGYDNLDLVALTHHGILATNTPDVLTEATAELTWALILALLRGLVPSREALLAGEWTSWSPDAFLGTEVSGKTLGIVGLGRIGLAVARRSPAFNVRAVALESGKAVPHASPFPRLPRREFLESADIVSLHVPLTASTRHLVNREWLDAMKSGSFLVNTARGAIVDELALKEALDSGKLAGAALDVFNEEPINGHHPLASHPRVLATPHIGSATYETRRQMALRAAGNLVTALSGKRPPDLLNGEAWPGRTQRFLNDG